MEKIRLKDFEIQAILEACMSRDRHCSVFLYGSRIDPNLKGGDIDLLVISELLSFSNKLDILVEIKGKIGDQKIDLSILNKNQYERDEFFKELSKLKIS